MAGWQDDPVVGAAPAASSGGGGWQNDPIVGATQTDASSKMSGIGRTLENALTLGGADWAYSKLPGMPSLETQKAQTAAAEQSVPAAIRIPAEIGAYAVGPGKFLGPAGAAIGGAGLGGVAAEGALAGGLASGFGSDFNPVSTGAGAVGGAALGAAAHGLTTGANAALQKTLGKPGTVDPAAAIASTAKDSADAYAKLHQVPADPQAITGALKGVLTGLDPSVVTGMSPGLKSTILDIGQTVQNLPEANAGQLDSWQRQINAAAQRERYPTDKVVAGKLDSAFDGLIKQAGAGDLQDAAQTAYQRSVQAQNLAEWTAKTQAGGSLGQAPLNEAENWYQGKPQYKDLVDLYQTNQGMMDPSYSLAHMGGSAAAMAGYHMAGPVGGMIAHPIGQQITKALSKNMVKKYRTGNMLAQLTAAYPGLTGIQPTGAVQAPQMPGDMIKNLMLGGMF